MVHEQKKKTTTRKLPADEILALVRQFLALNEKQRKQQLSSGDIKEWYRIKQNLELNLFSNPPIPHDQRKSIRIGGLKHPVRFEGDYEGSQAVIKEVSERGLFVAISDPLPVGTVVPVAVRIDNPEGTSGYDIRLRARVIYNNLGYSLAERSFAGMGMALDEENQPEERQKWFRWLDELLNEASDLYVK